MLASKRDNHKCEQLWHKYKLHNCAEARNDLIVAYSGLVNYVAGRVAIGLPPSVQKDDLVSYGIFGLIEAMERFDPDRGIKFETYAIARIKGAMLDGLRQLDWVPYSVRQRIKQLETTYAKLELEHGRAATDEEVCAHMGLSLEQYYGLLQDSAMTTIKSLDDMLTIDQNDQDSTRLIDLIEDGKALDPSLSAELNELKEVLADAIGKLPERERLVVALYYYEGLTLKEIGRVLGVSESRVSQMHTKSILRLRGRLCRVKRMIV